jgi:high frequency lysogenization protein
MGVTRDNTLALAGIFQAASLVNELATSGHADPAAFKSSVHSLFLIDADDVPSVYGGVSGVRHGLRELASLAGQQRNTETMAILGYAMSMMHLCRKFMRDERLVEHLAQNLEAMQRQRDYFGALEQDTVMNSVILARLADLYRQTIGSLQPRIMVRGDQQYLEQQDVVAQIRSLLLAGIRSTVLWNQLGGGRLNFLFRRRQYAINAESLLGSD